MDAMRRPDARAFSRRESLGFTAGEGWECGSAGAGWERAGHGGKGVQKLKLELEASLRRFSMRRPSTALLVARAESYALRESRSFASSASSLA